MFPLESCIVPNSAAPKEVFTGVEKEKRKAGYCAVTQLWRQRSAMRLKHKNQNYQR